MATCIHCHATDKGIFAPVCHNCNMYTPMSTQLIFEFFLKVVAPIVSIGLFFGILYLFFTWLLSPI